MKEPFDEDKDKLATPPVHSVFAFYERPEEPEDEWEEDCDDEEDEEEEEPDGWRFSSFWSDFLIGFMEFVPRLAPLCKEGESLATLGEVWRAFEFLADENPGVVIDLSLGYRQGDSDCNGGLFYTLDLCDQSLELGILQMSYTKEVGSDHSSRVIAGLGWDGSSEGDPFEWWNSFQEMAHDSQAELRGSRNL